jgi:hypothetical protein
MTHGVQLINVNCVVSGNPEQLQPDPFDKQETCFRGQNPTYRSPQRHRKRREEEQVKLPRKKIKELSRSTCLTIALFSSAPRGATAD